MDVIIPTGISEVVRLLAAVSQITINAPPNTIDTGSSLRCLGPVSRRTTWGTTRPTKPMIPVTEITDAVRRLDANRTFLFTNSIFTPNWVAVSSPVSITSSSRQESSMITSPMSTQGSTAAIWFQPFPFKVPMVQNII